MRINITSWYFSSTLLVTLFGIIFEDFLWLFAGALFLVGTALMVLSLHEDVGWVPPESKGRSFVEVLGL